MVLYAHSRRPAERRPSRGALDHPTPPEGGGPVRAPNANAYAERFVRSIKEECLDRIIPLGESDVRRTMAEYLAHSHGGRNHQGLRNELIAGLSGRNRAGQIRRRPRLGGLLNYYERAA